MYPARISRVPVPSWCAQVPLTNGLGGPTHGKTDPSIDRVGGRSGICGREFPIGARLDVYEKKKELHTHEVRSGMAFT